MFHESQFHGETVIRGTSSFFTFAYAQKKMVC